MNKNSVEKRANDMKKQFIKRTYSSNSLIREMQNETTQLFIIHQVGILKCLLIHSFDKVCTEAGILMRGWTHKMFPCSCVPVGVNKIF